MFDRIYWLVFRLATIGAVIGSCWVWFQLMQGRP